MIYDADDDDDDEDNDDDPIRPGAAVIRAGNRSRLAADRRK